MTKSIKTLLHGIVDYAGLFPPAELDMEAAIRNYAAYRGGEHAWMLGRFVVPVTRLSEFDSIAAEYLPHDSNAEPWGLTALVGPNVQADVERITAFNLQHRTQDAGIAQIDTVELKAASVADIETAVSHVPSALTPYVEIPLADNLYYLIQTLHQHNARAKIRTGGTTANAIPATAHVLQFIDGCIRESVPFKATAGLHHPLRALQKLTYESNSATGVMFGFLNVFLAAVFLHAGMRPKDAEALLEETQIDSFRFTDSHITWRSHTVDTATVEHVRQHLASSFGSCSFTEPVDDLKAMHLL